MVAEDFTLPLWGTDETSSLSDYRGEIVIMNMWASWCPPCRKEMPDLDRLYQDYKDVGVTVLGVNMNKFERTTEDADAFLEEFDVSFPTLIDVDGDVATDYQIQGLPMTYIIDEDGVINLVIRGEVNYEGLEEIILEMF
ncbi:TlpA family protein disulfide reductase [Desertibacillus haloalkaliphilus]|nr:TlpA family protein disulfide reductase [Desertibacillus haloalkaliphilus]